METKLCDVTGCQDKFRFHVNKSLQKFDLLYLFLVNITNSQTFTKKKEETYHLPFVKIIYFIK